MLNSLVYLQIMKRVIPLKKLSNFHFLNLEMFLPFVRRGLITGRSNSIWQSLYANLPVWNCIPASTPYFSSTKMHSYTMKYLNIHFEGFSSSKFDVNKFSIIPESSRSADLVSFLALTLSH